MSNSTSDPSTATAADTIRIKSESVTVKLMHDGQTLTFPVHSAVAANDDLLRDYLVSSGMTGAANGLVKRHEDGTIEVIKRAGPNGVGEDDTADGGDALSPVGVGEGEGIEGCARPSVRVAGLILAALQTASPHFNPAIALAWLLSRAEQQGGLDLMALVMAQGAIEAAVAQGETEVKQGTGILSRLEDARPVPWAGGSVLI